LSRNYGKPSRLPLGARRMAHASPREELRKACHKLYYGDENIREPPGKVSMFRGVVVVGAVLSVPDPGGDPVITCGGIWTIDDKDPRYAKALADHLRLMADGLDREAGS
jgi:hypothetical protein